MHAWLAPALTFLLENPNGFLHAIHSFVFESGTHSGKSMLLERDSLEGVPGSDSGAAAAAGVAGVVGLAALMLSGGAVCGLVKQARRVSFLVRSPIPPPPPRPSFVVFFVVSLFFCLAVLCSDPLPPAAEQQPPNIRT